MLTYDLNENKIGFYSKRVAKFENLTLSIKFRTLTATELKFRTLTVY